MCVSVDLIIKQIHDQPFNRELSRGSLPREKFIFYLVQDALYLADFSRALALTAARMSNNAQMQQFLQFSLEAIKAERDLHANYFQENSSLALLQFEQSPICFMYTNYLLKTACTASIEEAVASLLPCFWVYREVGKQILKSQTADDNPYREWIALYSGHAFDVSVQSVIDIVNTLGMAASDHSKEKMIAAFIRSTQLEWLFWDSAYRQEEWPIVQSKRCA